MPEEQTITSTPPQGNAQAGLATAMDKLFSKKEAAPVVETPAEPVVETPVETVSTEEPVVTEPKIEEPVAAEAAPEVVEEPVVETPEKEAAPVADTPVEPVVTEPVVDAPIELIDLDESEAAIAPNEPTSTDFNYNTLAAELGVEGNTREEIVKAVKSKVEIKHEAADNIYSKAAQIHAEGGDAKSYLFADQTEQRVNAMSEKELLADRYKDYSKNDENFSLDDFIEGKGEAETSVIANQHKQSLLANIADSKDRVQREATANKLKVDNGIKDALSTMDRVGNFAVKQTDKDLIENDLKTGKIFDDIYYDKDGNRSIKNAAEAIFRFRNGERMNAHYQKQAATSATKKVMKKLGNHDIEVPRPTGTQVVETKEKKGAAISLIEAKKAALKKTQSVKQ